MNVRLSLNCVLNNNVNTRWKDEKTLQNVDFVGFDFSVSPFGLTNLWSWRESNPRPNKEIIRLLHVYLRLDFRAWARPKPPIRALSFLFHCASKAKRNYPRFSCISISNRLEERAFGKCLVSVPSTKIKLIYYDSIKQQERSYFRQL